MDDDQKFGFQEETVAEALARLASLSHVEFDLVRIENYFFDRPFHKAASLLLDQVTIEREECLLRLRHRDRGIAA